MRERGKVQWYDSARGFGFIESHDSGASIFVHAKQLIDSGVVVLRAGDLVEFSVRQSDRTGKPSAQLVEVIAGAEQAEPKPAHAVDVMRRGRAE